MRSVHDSFGAHNLVGERALATGGFIGKDVETHAYAAVGHHRAQIRTAPDLEFDVLSDQPGDHLLHGLEHAVQVEHGGLEDLAPPEAKLDAHRIDQFRYDLAELHFTVGKKTEAAQAFLALLEVDSFSQIQRERIVEYVVDAYTDSDLMGEVDSERTLRQLNKVLELNPKTAKAWVLKGQIHLADGMANDAIEAFTQAIDIDSQIPSVHFSRAKAWLEMDKMARARSDLEMEVVIRATYNVLCELGRVLLLGADYDGALAQYDRAVGMEPERFLARIGRAKSYRFKSTNTSASRTARREFLRLADECFERVTGWLEGFDPDEVDFDSADGVVRIEFPDGVRFVLNRQAATDQMWFAAVARAWHYDRSEAGEWLCDKDGHELFGRISEAVSEKLGRPVHM